MEKQISNLYLSDNALLSPYSKKVHGTSDVQVFSPLWFSNISDSFENISVCLGININIGSL